MIPIQHLYQLSPYPTLLILSFPEYAEAEHTIGAPLLYFYPVLNRIIVNLALTLLIQNILQRHAVKIIANGLIQSLPNA